MSKKVLARYTPEELQPDIPVFLDRIIEWWTLHEKGLRTPANQVAFDDFQALLNYAIYEWERDPVFHTT